VVVHQIGSAIDVLQAHDAPQKSADIGRGIQAGFHLYTICDASPPHREEECERDGTHEEESAALPDLPARRPPAARPEMPATNVSDQQPGDEKEAIGANAQS